MTHHIWYDPSGQIVAVGSPGPGVNIAPAEVSDGPSFLELDLGDLDPERLHEDYAVDVATGSLKRR